MVVLKAAEIERELISQRTKEALAKRKAVGKPLGRPKGNHGVSILDQHEERIREYPGHCVSKAALARMHDCSWQTVHNGSGGMQYNLHNLYTTPLYVHEINRIC